MRALPAPITTTLWLENSPTALAMTTVPSRVPVPQPDTGLPFKQ
jgi:hypothetical protein